MVTDVYKCEQIRTDLRVRRTKSDSLSSGSPHFRVQTMADSASSIIKRYYDNFLISQESDCYFLSCDNQDFFRAEVDSFCKDNGVECVKLQMSARDACNPFSLVVSLVDNLLGAHSEAKAKLIDEFSKQNPEMGNVGKRIVGEVLEELSFPLPDEVFYRSSIQLRVFNSLIDQIMRTSPIKVIFISDFHHASSSFLRFFISFLKHKHQDGFLIFCSYNPAERQDIVHDSDNIWIKWLWELESSGRLIHNFHVMDDCPRVEWTKTGKPYDKSNVAQNIALAEELINMFCFREAVFVLHGLSKRHGESLSLPVKIRLDLLYGRAHLFSGQYEKALVSFDRLNDLGQKFNDPYTLCLSNVELAYTNLFRGDYKSANRYVAYSLNYLRNTAKLTLKEEEIALRARLCEFQLADLSSTSFKYSRIVPLLEELNKQGLVRERIYVLARVFSQEPSNPELTNEKCFEYVDEAIDLATRYNMQLELAVAKQSKGIICSKLGDVDEAIKYLQESEVIREHLNLPSELARIKNGIGYLYSTKGDLMHAHDYYISAMRTVIDLRDLSEISSTLYNLAWVYFLGTENDGSLKVLSTLWEILRLKDTKYFPFRNVHDVYLLNGLCYFFKGHYVHAQQCVDNSMNLDISVSDQGSMIRPLLKALLGTVYKNDDVMQYLRESEDALTKFRSQLSPQHAFLFHMCRVFVLRSVGDIEGAYRDLRLVCRQTSELTTAMRARRTVAMMWKKQRPTMEINMRIPVDELKHIMAMIKHESAMSDLWKQVNGMRLCSIIQQLTMSNDDVKYVTEESIRLLCMHFNVQGGFVYTGDEREHVMHACYSQLKNYVFKYENFAEFIKRTENHEEGHEIYVFTRQVINGHVFSSILKFPLMDGRKCLGHMILTTFIDDFTPNSTDIDTIKFIANQMASKIINMRQRKELQRLSIRDQLTGLKNRACFSDLLKGVKHQTDCVLAFIDLDNFKNYNDTFGHESGDFLLIWFSELLSEIETDRIQVCRWGGDEFLVLFSNMTGEEARSVMEDLHLKLKKKNGFVAELRTALGRDVFVEKSRYLDFSAGLCIAENCIDSIDDGLMLQIADKTLYDVKRSGKARIVSSAYVSHLKSY